MSIKDVAADLKADLFTTGKGIEINDELVKYIHGQPGWKVKVEVLN